MYAYKATSDLDTSYLHESMKTHDWPQFRQVMQKEIDDRMEGQNFSVIKKITSPKNSHCTPRIMATQTEEIYQILYYQKVQSPSKH